MRLVPPMLAALASIDCGGKILDLDASADVMVADVVEAGVCHGGDPFPCGELTCYEGAGCEIGLRPDGAVTYHNCSQEGVPQCGACDTCACAYPGYPEESDSGCFCQMRNGHTYFTCPSF